MKFNTRDKASGVKYFTPTKISENIRETPEGFLLCVGVPIARTGEMIYGDGETPLETGKNGKVVIDRSEKEVFSEQTISSFEGKPITIQHPKDFVTPENWKDLTVGIVQNVRRGEGESKNDLLADLLITDSKAIGLVRDGLREVSCGYEAEYEQTGDGRGTQHNIIGNHLALVEEGRAGSSYAIKDHKEKGEQMSKDKKKTLISRIFDTAKKDAEKIIDEAGGEEKEKADDAVSLDEKISGMMKVINSMNEKIESMSGGKDAAKEKEEEAPAKDEEAVPAKDDIEGRLAKLESAVAKLLESQATGDEEVEVESEDDDFEESTMSETGDSAEDEDDEDESVVDADTRSRAEILVPGIKPTKDMKAQALKLFAATKDGKEVMKVIAGGKLTLDNKQQTDLMFNAASEMMKLKRTKTFASAKAHDVKAAEGEVGATKKLVTPELMNKKNEEFYKNRK